MTSCTWWTWPLDSQLLLESMIRTSTVAKKFTSGWLHWAGAPLYLVSDQGSEWLGAFQALTERLGTGIRTAGLEAPWQIGVVERAGAVLGEIMRITIDEAYVVGKQEMKLTAVFSAKAKNSRVTASGYSARARVFGLDERLPGGLVEQPEMGENEAEIQVGSPQVERERKIRLAAGLSLRKLEASYVWRSVLTGKPRTQILHHITPGAQVLYWRRSRTSQNLRGRGVRLAERWHGPALVIGKHQGNAWVSHNGYLFLVPTEHLRLATREERVADLVMGQYIKELSTRLLQGETDADLQVL